MIVKASIAATALICAVVSLSSIDFRELYDEMYPVNGLRRDVLGLCGQAEPTFVRAVRSDRHNCYDSMPDAVERAIGWVRTSSRLAAMRRTPTAVELAERLLVEAATAPRVGVPGPHQFGGYATMSAAALPACGDTATALAAAAATTDLAPAYPSDRLANDRLARRIAGGEETALAALGLLPRDARRAPELPVLSLSGAGDAALSVAASASASTASALFDPMPSANLRDGSALSLAPRAATPGCKIPA